MIIKASERGGGKQLGLHLMNTHDNEHVEVHEIRGFVADDVVGAFKEAYAVSKGTRAKNFLFSVSFNPPEDKEVDFSVFEDAINRVEEKNGLTGQPRVIVKHEKEGRSHAHAVWSRIDVDTMTAKHMSFFKEKCMDVSREMFLEHGWKMPKGMMSREARDPRNFTLEEWQQSKRIGFHARDLKQEIQECWAVSDSRAAFSSALEERGMKLARGDRRGHVIVTHEGEVMSVARYAGKKAKAVRERLGDEKELSSVEEIKAQFTKELTNRFEQYLKQQDLKSQRDMTPLEEERKETTAIHRQEREKLAQGQKQRWEQETKERAARLNTGIKGLWDRMTGAHAKTIKQSEQEAYAALQRDKEQKQSLLQSQHTERRSLQGQISTQRAKATKERLEIHRRLDQLRKGNLKPDKLKIKPRPTHKKVKSAKAGFTNANQPQAPPDKQPTEKTALHSKAHEPVQRPEAKQKLVLSKERLAHLRQQYLKSKTDNKTATPATAEQKKPRTTHDKLNLLRSQKRSIGKSRTLDKSPGKKGPTLERY